MALDLADPRFLYGARERLPRVVTVASPAAGADWSQAVGGGLVWQPLAATAKLTTSAVASSRNPVLQFTDQTTVFAAVQPIPQLGASNVILFSWLRNLGNTQNQGTGFGSSLALPDLPLLPGFLWRVVTANLDTGDQWTQVALYAVEYVEYPPLYEAARELAELLRTVQTPGFPEWEAS